MISFYSIRVLKYHTGKWFCSAWGAFFWAWNCGNVKYLHFSYQYHPICSLVLLSRDIIWLYSYFDYFHLNHDLRNQTQYVRIYYTGWFICCNRWFWKLYLQITSSERHDFFPLENSSEYLYTLSLRVRKWTLCNFPKIRAILFTNITTNVCKSETSYPKDRYERNIEKIAVRQKWVKIIS